MLTAPPYTLTAVPLRLPNYERLLEIRRSRGFSTFDETIGWVLDAAVSGGARAPVSRRCHASEWYPTGRQRTAAKKKVRCRRRPGHDGRHRWWSRLGHFLAWGSSPV